MAPGRAFGLRFVGVHVLESAGMTDTLLIVDDESDVVELLAYNLQKAGFKTILADNGTTALEKARGHHPPSLILLDLMLPGMEGTEVCRQLKADARTAKIPIIMLTAKAEEVDRVVGLELGADDYVTKPFSPREIVLRVKSVLRRAKGEATAPESLQHGQLVVDLTRHEARLKGRPMTLTPIEFKLLATLMERRGRVQSRDRLLADVWEYNSETDTRTVDTHMRRLRDKLGKAADFIETVRGIGYRFSDQS